MDRCRLTLGMMGWVLATTENSSAVGGVLRVGTHGVMAVVGYDYYTRSRLLYKATTTLQGYDYFTRLRRFSGGNKRPATGLG